MQFSKQKPVDPILVPPLKKGNKRTIMQRKILRIGRIPYANLFPIFYYLDSKCDQTGYRFTKGVPSRLNKLLRDGKLDISPSSSIEYLRNRDRYLILPFFSISSSGPIDSILLFSKLPLNEMGGKTIALSSESDTSVVLLKIILKEFLSIKCKFRTVRYRSVKNALSSFTAFLLIGDTAMKEAKKTVTKRDHTYQTAQSIASHRSPITHYPSVYKYDLAELWHIHTGLPFVFALWIVRREAISEKKDLIMKLSIELLHANRYALGKFPLIAKKFSHNKWLDEKTLVGYWKKISYNLTDKHLEGLRLFEKYAKDL